MIFFLNSVLAILTVSYAGASNATVEFTYNDVCTNECNDTDSSYWCGKRRMDSEGFIYRCMQLTREGAACVSRCRDEKHDSYKWCMINAVALASADWWDYCSLAGYTINKEKCWDDCDKRGEDYWWCHTSEKQDKWDYCSPHGMVKPMQITIYGEQCKIECGQHDDTDYYWCNKNRDVCSSGRGNRCDDNWDYCSMDDMHTRYGKKCKKKCSAAGEDYYWCNTVDGSWDYCSPIPKDGYHLSLEIELDIYGLECRTRCHTYGYNYFWCKQIGGRNGNWWDYCSPVNKTRYNEPCTDQCKRRGQKYNWCHTQSSWDYCSPSIDSLESGASSKCWQFTLLVFALCCIKSNLDKSP